MKIKIKTIEFPFSESGNPCLKSVYTSWKSAENALASVVPPAIGYYKTDFRITYEDNNVYEGRYDIGSDTPSLSSHIQGFCERIIGNAKRVDKLRENNQAKEFKEFVKKYYIGD